MSKPLISVIVPIYKVEKYLKRCVDSIINQSYKNLEIILVDDGSPDLCPKICDNYSKKDKRIKVIHKKNGGLSDARNKGLDIASGEYISFIDSDDYISENYFEELVKAMISNKADVAITDIKTVYEDTGSEIINKAYTETQDLIGFVNTGLAASACNKLIKKSYYDKYKFEVGKINEDIAVIIPIMVHASKIVYVENVFYYYIQRNNSIQNSNFSDKRFDIINAVDLTLSRIEGIKNYDRIKDALVFNQIILLLIYVIPKIKNVFKRSSVITKFRKYTKKYDIQENAYYKRFLLDNGKKHKLYYGLYVGLAMNGLSLLSSFQILFYELLKNIFKPSIIQKYNDDVLIKRAIKNSNMPDYGIKISVVIPNYNYARFLGQRLDSILSQRVRLNEIIILDDCSTDNSREVIDKYINLLNNYINIKKIFNNKNTGTAFKQWKKGFENATGDYVWIAEADDYCNKNLLYYLVQPIIKNKGIMISYSDTAFIDIDGRVRVKSIKSEIDIQKTGHWDTDYINDGKDEISMYSYLNNTIANVSSCLIKNGNYEEFFNKSIEYKQAGDWIFYVNVMSLGKVSYKNKALNYYRVHGNNVSSVTKKEKHLNEILSIYDFINNHFEIEENRKKKQKERIGFLKDVWRIE